MHWRTSPLMTSRLTKESSFLNTLNVRFSSSLVRVTSLATRKASSSVKTVAANATDPKYPSPDQVQLDTPSHSNISALK